MFSHIATSDFFILAMVVPAGLACVTLMSVKFIKDMKAHKRVKNAPMAVRNK